MPISRKTKKLRKPFYKSVVFGITIVSQDKKHIVQFEKALLLIKKTDRRLFLKVVCLKAILIYPGENQYGAVYEKERIFIDQPKSMQKVSSSWLASILVHEAWHIDQYKRKIREFGVKTEKGAYLVQRRFLLKVGVKSEIKWLDKVYQSKWWESETKKAKNSQGYDKKSVEKNEVAFWKFMNQYKAKKLSLIEI